MNQANHHRRRFIISLAIVAVLLIASVSITAYAMQARTVIIRDDGVATTITTTKQTVHEILLSQEITLNNDDYLVLDDFSETADSTIRIYRAKQVYLTDDGIVRQLRAAGTVQRLLDLYDIALGERDKLNRKKTDLLENGMQIEIERAFDVAVVDYGAQYSLSLTSGSVGGALELCGVTLEGEDYTTPDADTELVPGLTIHVYRVEFRERKKTASIDYETETKKSAKMDLGKSKIEQKGVQGKKETLYQDKYVNGERVESIVLQENILTQPVKEIKTIGTKAAKLRAGLTPISTMKLPSSVTIENGVPTKYKDVIVGTAKAYSGGGTCAVGVKARPGYIAVNPKQIPYGTQLYIVSNDGRYIYGYAIAADTGGFVKKKSCTIDLYMDNESMCNQWGHRGVTIYVLDLPKIKF
ncbi:MAG: ubiquitin-like domain-containing protein [Oscillospiraceae bacterium]|jgi:uncharacterized protein YabE (DUF348 family)/3D (Asp-Asp-Asp) domain-containing protein|nr:ubiquitin-like domain-containing protein [Oscillospiraceae bacterium]